MKTKICAALLCVTLIPPVYAIDQWPGQSDFGNANGQMPNTDQYRQRPIVDFRFARTDRTGRLRHFSVSAKPIFDAEGRRRLASLLFA